MKQRDTVQNLRKAKQWKGGSVPGNLCHLVVDIITGDIFNLCQSINSEIRYSRQETLTTSRSAKHSPMIFTAFFKSSSSITRGGAKRMLQGDTGQLWVHG